jgi:hypothetical protein
MPLFWAGARCRQCLRQPMYPCPVPQHRGWRSKSYCTRAMLLVQLPKVYLQQLVEAYQHDICIVLVADVEPVGLARALWTLTGARPNAKVAHSIAKTYNELCDHFRCASARTFRSYLTLSFSLRFLRFLTLH